jgi:hypothetical protein
MLSQQQMPETSYVQVEDGEARCAVEDGVEDGEARRAVEDGVEDGEARRDVEDGCWFVCLRLLDNCCFCIETWMS